jgi:hypothetical protein
MTVYVLYYLQMVTFLAERQHILCPLHVDIKSCFNIIIEIDSCGEMKDHVDFRE